MTERSAVRRFDAVALKEIRKRLDTGACDQQEVDQIATDLLEDCVDVSVTLIRDFALILTKSTKPLCFQLSSDVRVLRKLQRRIAADELSPVRSTSVIV
jgi:hypothetical protein